MLAVQPPESLSLAALMISPTLFPSCFMMYWGDFSTARPFYIPFRVTSSKVSTHSRQALPFFFTWVFLRLLTNGIGEGVGKKEWHVPAITLLIKTGGFAFIGYNMGSCAGEILGLGLYFHCENEVLVACPQTSFMRLWLPIFSAQALGLYVSALWILQFKRCYLGFDPPTTQRCLLCMTYDQWRVVCSALDLQSQHGVL